MSPKRILELLLNCYHSWFREKEEGIKQLDIWSIQDWNQLICKVASWKKDVDRHSSYTLDRQSTSLWRVIHLCDLIQLQTP
ncbi:hypothetical protein OUZ56_029114 [Daphnia magna]|uniref:Uncharacterized protein n=1 Tax=Daphnia magna TaxID=35525 RepID=A0ABR0B5W0_9CRUS|nr:hypothetical protein OUZ56_029114 [Daphnia magna]